MDNGALGLHWVAGDGTILWANPADYAPLGYTAEEYIGHHIAEFHADADIIADILHRLTAGETLQNYEARLRCKDGGVRSVLITSNVMFDEVGNFVHTRCFTRDVTEYKRIERERVEEQFRLLVDAVKDYAIVLLDEDGQVLSWNAGVESIHGYGAEQIIGQRFSCFYTDEDARAGKPQRDLAVAAEVGRVEEDGVRRRRDGSELWANMVITALRNEDGRLSGFALVTRDLTERKRAEEERARLQEEIIRAQEAMLAELSTPLIPITDGVVVLPLIGTMSRRRADQVKATLLQGISAHQAKVAIIDITGVPTVDAAIIGALIGAANAARLLGAQVVLTGIRPDVAQSLVHLGVDLRGIVPLQTLQSGVAFATAAIGADRPTGAPRGARLAAAVRR